MLGDRAEPCFSHESLLWALEAICVRLQQAFLPENVARALVPPHTLHVLQRAAARAGIAARIVAASPDALASLTLPCVIELRAAAGSAGGDDPAPDPGRDVCLAVIVAREPNGFRLLAPEASQPEVVSAAELGRRYLGRAVTFERPPPPDPDAEQARPAERFGVASVVRETIRQRAIWRDVVVASVAIQLVALLVPLLTQVVIDKVIVHQASSTLLAVAVALAAILLFNAAMTWVRQYLVLHAGNRVDAALGERVVERLLALPPRYFEHRPTGTLVARLQGVEVIREFVAGAGVTLLLDVPLALLFLVLMFWYSATLSGIVLAGVALLVVLSLAVTPALRARVDHQFLQAARNQAFLTETVAAIDTVKALQMEPGLRARYGALLAAYLQAGLAARSLANGLNVSATALEQAMTAAVLCIGAWLVMEQGALTIGMLVAFQMLAGRVTGPMLRAASLWQEFQRVRIAADRLGDIMNVAPEPAGGEALRPVPAGGRVEIQQLSFRYSDDGPLLLRDVSLSIAAGECVALMGPSGSGKSTLARLLIGFYRPTGGRILLDGVDARDLGADALRAAFGVVPQETRLFAGTVFDNLAAACPRASFDEVVSACRLAGIHETLNALPNGYGSWVGEQGVGLSGGQRQRIAIARALLRRAPILLFDEATSSLDEASAALVAQAINRLRGRVTIVFIAHHLPPGLTVDRTIRLAHEPEGAFHAHA